MVSCNPNLSCDKIQEIQIGAFSVIDRKLAKQNRITQNSGRSKNSSRPVFFMKKQCFIVFQNSKAYFARYVQFNTILVLNAKAHWDSGK